MKYPSLHNLRNGSFDCFILADLWGKFVTKGCTKHNMMMLHLLVQKIKMERRNGKVYHL